MKGTSTMKFDEDAIVMTTDHEMPTLQLDGPYLIDPSYPKPKFEDYRAAAERRGVPLAFLEAHQTPAYMWTIHLRGGNRTPEQIEALQRELDAERLPFGGEDDDFEEVETEVACRLLSAIHRATGAILKPLQ